MKMKKTLSLFMALSVSFASLYGCVPVFIGVGALAGYAISKDTLQAEIDISFDDLVEIAEKVLLDMQAEIAEEDAEAGRIKAKIGAGIVKISIDSLTKTTQRLRISSRKAMLPDLSTANKILVKILEETH